MRKSQFPLAASDSTRGQSLRLCRLVVGQVGTRRNWFIEKAVRQWNGLEAFEERLDMARGLVNEVVITQRLDSIISEVFPT